MPTDSATESNADPRRPKYTGRMEMREGVITGWLEDAWGWRIKFSARKEGSAYILDGDLGETPPSLQFPILDR